MNIQVVDINFLKEAEKNVRIHPEQQILELKRSVENFGQIRPIVADENGVIIAGHGLWQALQLMGKTEANVIILDNLSESDKKKLMLADNKIYELGNTNFDNMLEILEEISLDGVTLDIPGYDIEILESLLADAAETDLKLSEYGDISEGKKKELQEERQALEESDMKPEEREIVLNNEMIKVEQKKTTDRPRPYVECPNCGEKIWL